MLHCLPPRVLLYMYGHLGKTLHTCYGIWMLYMYIYIHDGYMYMCRSYLSCSFLWESLVVCAVPSGACVHVSYTFILCVSIYNVYTYAYYSVFKVYMYMSTNSLSKQTYVLHVTNTPVSVCVSEHCTCRDNLATDGFYGLMIVLLSLVGFISVVWLQDQIRNGGGPQWLERDRIEVHRMERREAEDELNNLQAHLDEVERRARARQRAPERVEAAREVSLLWAERDKYLEKLQVIQSQRFDRKLEELRLRAMELSYDLGVGQKHYMMLLGSARHKYGKNLDSWREEHNLGAQGAGSNCPPPDWKKGLSREELAIMEVRDNLLDTNRQCAMYKMSNDVCIV